MTTEAGRSTSRRTRSSSRRRSIRQRRRSSGAGGWQPFFGPRLRLLGRTRFGDLDLAIRQLVKIREASHVLRSCSGNIGAVVLRELLGRTRDVTRESIATEGQPCAGAPAEYGRFAA
jgi:hypothetical protein